MQAKILGIPLMNDQRPNLKRAVRHGNARMLEWGDLTAAELAVAIREVIGDEDMGAAADRLHRLYSDRQHRDGGGSMEGLFGIGLLWNQSIKPSEKILVVFSSFCEEPLN